ILPPAWSALMHTWAMSLTCSSNSSLARIACFRTILSRRRSATSCVFTDAVLIHSPGLKSTTLKCKFRRRCTQGLQGLRNLVLLLELTIQKHVTATTGACNLAAQSAMMARRLVHFINSRIADAGGNTFLRLPG